MENKEIDTYFKVNEEMFKKLFLAHYEKKEKMKKLIIFVVFLPYYFPIQEGSSITRNKEEHNVTFLFEKVYKDFSYIYNIPNEENKLKKSISKVIMMYSTEKIDNDLTPYFDNLIDYLNEILMAYKIKSKDSEVYQIRKEMLNSLVLYRIMNINKWDKINDGIFIINNNIPYDEETMNSEDMLDVMRHYNIIMQELNPFVNTTDYLINAKRLLYSGFYEDSVINANIAVESYIRNIYKYFLKEENPLITEDEINIQLEETAFMKIIKSEISRRIGGIWDVNQESTEIGKWYKNTYKLRNQVVHGTRKIEFEQSLNAFLSANEIIKYIKSLILLNKKKYPMLSQYFI